MAIDGTTRVTVEVSNIVIAHLGHWTSPVECRVIADEASPTGYTMEFRTPLERLDTPDGC